MIDEAPSCGLYLAYGRHYVVSECTLYQGGQSANMMSLDPDFILDMVRSDHANTQYVTSYSTVLMSLLLFIVINYRYYYLTSL